MSLVRQLSESASARNSLTSAVNSSGVLEERSVTGVRVDHQARVLDAPVHVVGVWGWHHVVGVPVHDEGRHRDERQVVGGRGAPALDRAQLAQEGTHGHGRVRVLLRAGAEAGEDLACFRFAVCVMRVEDISLGIRAVQSRAEHVAQRRGGDLVDALARARTRTDQDEALDQAGIVAHDLLSDHPAHRQA